jgi:hypothetical protein
MEAQSKTAQVLSLVSGITGITGIDTDASHEKLVDLTAPLRTEHRCPVPSC